MSVIGTSEKGDRCSTLLPKKELLYTYSLKKRKEKIHSPFKKKKYGADWKFK